MFTVGETFDDVFDLKILENAFVFMKQDLRQSRKVRLPEWGYQTAIQHCFLIMHACRFYIAGFICDSVMTENDNCDFACMCVMCSVHI